MSRPKSGTLLDRKGSGQSRLHTIKVYIDLFQEPKLFCFALTSMTATLSKILKMNSPKSKTWTWMDAKFTLLDAKVISSQRFLPTKFWHLLNVINALISRHLPNKMRELMSALKQLWKIVLSKNFRKWRSRRFILRVSQWKTKVSKRHAVENDKQYFYVLIKWFKSKYYLQVVSDDCS